MQLSCVHCGKHFTISVDQLGGTGRCPHCRGEIRLPRAEDPSDQLEQVQVVHSSWWENSVSGLASLVFHLVLILIFALIKFGGQSGEGLAEDVLIGELPSVQLGDSNDEVLSQEEQPKSEESAEMLDEMLEVEPPIEPTTDAFSDEQLAIVSPSTSGGDTGSFDLGR